MRQQSIHHLLRSGRWARCIAMLWLLVGVGSASAQLGEQNLTDALRDLLQQQAEDEAAEEAEDAAEDETESELEQSIKDLVDEQTEDDAVEDAEESVEDDLTFGGGEQDTVEEDVTEQVEETVEDEVAEETNSGAEEAAEDVAEEEVEEQIDGQSEQQLVDVAEESAETEVEEQVEESVVTAAEDAVAEEVEETDVASSEEELPDSSLLPDEGAEEVVAGEGDAAGGIANEERIGAEGDELLESLEAGLSDDDARIHLGQWLVMAESPVFDELSREGYVFDSVTDLPSLGLRLAEVSAPASFDISAAREGIYDVVGSDRAEVDLNHFYTAGVPDASPVDAGISPREALDIPAALADKVLRIGVIDSEVDVSHASLLNADINTKRFTRASENLPNFHGTAIASLFVANDENLVGLVPNSTLYSAAVFETDADKGEIASTVSLVKSLDWLLQADVDVINLSLTGPPNRLLEVAINKVSRTGVVVLAAAGNDGPMATPRYPAAYSSVVAVTAVDSRGRAFRLANRGDYLALAAPGVNLRHALAGGGYTTSSGTSFAVPFVSTVVALLKQDAADDDVVARLYASALDLGEPGRDEVYGYGLLTIQ
jgi:subtilisin family serine protease